MIYLENKQLIRSMFKFIKNNHHFQCPCQEYWARKYLHIHGCRALPQLHPDSVSECEFQWWEAVSGLCPIFCIILDAINYTLFTLWPQDFPAFINTV